MMYVYTISEQTVAAAAPIEFTTIGVSKCRSTTQATETTLIIGCPGIYEITFNGTATAAGTAQLYVNGEEIDGAVSTGTTLTFTALIRVNPNCCAVTNNLPARIQVINDGAAALTLTNVALTIIKVG